MNVLLIGGPGSLTNHMIVKLKKEGHRVSLLTGESYARKGYEKVFETYTFTYDSDSLKEIFESVCPDSILFMGAYDTNFNWNESEREAVRFISAIMNILLSYSVEKNTRFFFLSSDEVFGLLAKQKNLQEKEDKMDALLKEELAQLEKIAGYSKEKARKLIMERVESDMELEITNYIKEEEAKARLEAHEVAKQLIVSSMERYADDVVGNQTVSTIDLPNDDMKGRLIGREGRNIRTIESVTGVDLIIDDTPEAISLSSFDPLRREIAKITIETLIKDGRIHPGRIEEVYDKTLKDVNARIIQIGNQTINDLGITKMDPELVTLIGKLNFRTSYGQNALKHSIEVANLCGLMAAELGENVTLAKRAGLLHDIGKSIDFEVEGSHVEIGLEFAKRHHEPDVVLDAIASHHGDIEAKSTIAVLVAIADTLSAARPGARNDSLENYIKRLEQLEEIGNSYEGVEKTFAMQAGRELRVIVKPQEVDDDKSYKIARDIKEQIENEMQYPGTIKVTVIRETRVQEEAK